MSSEVGLSREQVEKQCRLVVLPDKRQRGPAVAVLSLMAKDTATRETLTRWCADLLTTPLDKLDTGVIGQLGLLVAFERLHASFVRELVQRGTLVSLRLATRILKSKELYGASSTLREVHPFVYEAAVELASRPTVATPILTGAASLVSAVVSVDKALALVDRLPPDDASPARVAYVRALASAYTPFQLFVESSCIVQVFRDQVPRWLESSVLRAEAVSLAASYAEAIAPLVTPASATHQALGPAVFVQVRPFAMSLAQLIVNAVDEHAESFSSSALMRNALRVACSLHEALSVPTMTPTTGNDDSDNHVVWLTRLVESFARRVTIGNPNALLCLVELVHALPRDPSSSSSASSPTTTTTTPSPTSSVNKVLLRLLRDLLVLAGLTADTDESLVCTKLLLRTVDRLQGLETHWVPLVANACVTGQVPASSGDTPTPTTTQHEEPVDATDVLESYAALPFPPPTWWQVGLLQQRLIESRSQHRVGDAVSVAHTRVTVLVRYLLPGLVKTPAASVMRAHLTRMGGTAIPALLAVCGGSLQRAVDESLWRVLEGGGGGGGDNDNDVEGSSFVFASGCDWTTKERVFLLACRESRWNMIGSFLESLAANNVALSHSANEALQALVDRLPTPLIPTSTLTALVERLTNPEHMHGRHVHVGLSLAHALLRAHPLLFCGTSVEEAVCVWCTRALHADCVVDDDADAVAQAAVAIALQVMPLMSGGASSHLCRTFHPTAMDQQALSVALSSLSGPRCTAAVSALRLGVAADPSSALTVRDFVVSQLEHHLSTAERNLTDASLHAPVHGPLCALRHITSFTNENEDVNDTHWVQLFEWSERVFAVAAIYVCAPAPEGSVAPTFAVCAWRMVCEACSFLADAAASSSSKIVSPARLSRAGLILMRLLKQVAHKGALSKASEAFATVCQALWHCAPSCPRRWLALFLASIDGTLAERSDAEDAEARQLVEGADSMTRRGAGLSQMIMVLVRGSSSVNSDDEEATLNEVIGETLAVIIRVCERTVARLQTDTLSLDDESHCISALYVAFALVRDSVTGPTSTLSLALSDLVRVCVACSRTIGASFPLQNAAHMTLSQCAARIQKAPLVHVARLADAITLPAESTTTATVTAETTTIALLACAESAFSRHRTPNAASREARDWQRRVAASSGHFSRVAAARALTALPFAPFDHDSVDALASQLVESHNTNATHGILLQLREILKRNKKTEARLSESLRSKLSSALLTCLSASPPPAILDILLDVVTLHDDKQLTREHVVPFAQRVLMDSALTASLTDTHPSESRCLAHLCTLALTAIAPFNAALCRCLLDSGSQELVAECLFHLMTMRGCLPLVVSSLADAVAQHALSDALRYPRLVAAATSVLVRLTRSRQCPQRDTVHRSALRAWSALEMSRGASAARLSLASLVGALLAPGEVCVTWACALAEWSMAVENCDARDAAVCALREYGYEKVFQSRTDKGATMSLLLVSALVRLCQDEDEQVSGAVCALVASAAASESVGVADRAVAVETVLRRALAVYPGVSRTVFAQWLSTGARDTVLKWATHNDKDDAVHSIAHLTALAHAETPSIALLFPPTRQSETVLTRECLTRIL